MQNNSYLDDIIEIINKPGNKINVNGYQINEVDKEEFLRLLNLEKIFNDKDLYLKSTKELINNIENRLKGLKDTEVIEKEALNNILNILLRTNDLDFQDLVLSRKILVPKDELDSYNNNLSKTIFGRSKPLRDASKEDLEDLVYDVTSSQEQRKRINNYNKDNNSVDNLLKDLDEGLTSLKSVKQEALKVIQEYNTDFDDYKEYITKLYNDYKDSDNITLKLYYTSLYNKLDSKTIIDPIYKYNKTITD